MITVIVKGKAIPEIMDMVYGLRRDGYLQGIDFDFAYHPEDWGDGFTMTPLREKYTEFRFYDEHLAMMFKLRYSGE